MLDAVFVITLIAALAAFAMPTRQTDSTPTEARTEAQRVTAMLETGHVAGMSDMVVRS